MTTPTDLDGLTAAAALAAFATEHSSAIGFAYAPQAAPWFRLRPDAAPCDAHLDPVNLTGVFELRAFDGDAELRWWNVPGEGSRAQVITDERMAGQGLAAGYTYRRLLWGQARPSQQDGWLTLFEARIGELRVPVDGQVEQGGRVWLEAVEYHREDEHGNVAVVDERLVGLTAVRTDQHD